MTTKLQAVRGTHDILPEEAVKRRHIAESWRSLAVRYGYGEIQTPVFEFSDVFHRTLGDTSDVVTKETYTFEDRGGESLTLRPEFTASVVRAFINAGLTQDLPQKFFYYGPAFRYERPQKGRLRQFHQVGAELLGAAEPEADAEMIALAVHGLRMLELLPHVRLEINSLGTRASRQEVRNALVACLSPHQADLSEDSRNRLERNPQRILDSKDKRDQEIIVSSGAGTVVAGFLEHPEVSPHFNRVLSLLDAFGIRYTVNPRIVRGLDYYNHTVFEFVTDRLGAQGTVLAGGRYDGLVSMMGGPEVPGVGFAAGVERMLALMEEVAALFPVPEALIAVIPVGEEAEGEAWKLAQELRELGYAVDIAYKGNAGKRLKRADKLSAKLALMLGGDELAANAVTLKNLVSGEQKTLPRTVLAAEMETQLRQ